MGMELKSSAFDPGGVIPRKYTGEGEDVSPPLSWNKVPEEARELALICDDPDAPTPKPWVHWVVYNIDPSATGFPEGSVGGATEGVNDFGRTGYGGPMPPKGHGVHHYHFKLYALGEKLNLSPGLSKDQLLSAMEGKIIGEAELVGTYERK